MFVKSRIRSQMIFGLAMLVVVVIVLSFSGIHGAIKFRELTKNIRSRARELPLTAELNRSVTDLRLAYSQIYRPADFWSSRNELSTDRQWAISGFVDALRIVRIALRNYEDQLSENRPSDPRIADVSDETRTVDQLQSRLDHIDRLIQETDLVFENRGHYVQLEDELAQLQPLIGHLPGFLKARMDAFSEQVRGEYYSWMVITAIFLGVAILLLAWLVVVFRQSIFRPLALLIAGSRRVAGGDYGYRIECPGDGELAELAVAFNEMTANFLEIKTDLDQQVKLRTKEIVRKEQLASVGFLAAGVAHEINNPLAAIAWSAESLEMRLHAILAPYRSAASSDPNDAEVQEMLRYLQRIQSEAFRCKNITAGLLDFSRLGDSRKSPQSIGELLEGVVEMIRPLTKYRDRKIEVQNHPAIIAQVNAQEFKQVILNLLTNALDSIDAGGTVWIRLETQPARFRLVIADNGCGMSPEVQQHLFEPFFTRRRDGQGTGLGLSITYRIVEEHGGTIRAHSDGVGRGSRFEIDLPLTQTTYGSAQPIAA